MTDLSTAATQTRRRPVGGTAGQAEGQPGGLLLGLGCYVMWGLVPLYFRVLEPASSIEVVAHRIVWGLLVCVVLLVLWRRVGQLLRIFRQPRVMGLLTAAALLIGLNWLVYIFGVMSGRTVDVALGYFINPIFTIVLAAAVLRERLRPLQWAAIGVAGVAVLVIAVGYGELPWVALAISVTFGLYGLTKNRVGRSVGALEGIAVETLVLTPLAGAYILVLAVMGTGAFSLAEPAQARVSWLLIASGLITVVPLLLFGAASRRLRLSMMGMLQYATPIMQFFLGVVIFHEEMPTARWIGVGLVVIAVAVLMADGLVQRSLRRAVPV